MIEVLKPGLLTTIQDLGRAGHAHLGVPRSGALDIASLVLANRLVGNPDGAAGLETTLTGVSFRAELPTAAAVTGAPARVTVNGQPVEFGNPFQVAAGAVVQVGAAIAGVRSYVAFAGGVTVAPVLGSRSTDTLSGLGPPPLRAGFVFPLARTIPDPLPTSLVEQARRGTGPPDGRSERIRLQVRMGPRHDWFSQAARDAFLAGPYTLSVKSNRVGARLTGAALHRSVRGELPSEGIVLGAVQVPADGQPLVFLADHPTTGGYPVIGVVDANDLPLLAQARPDTTVIFDPWT
jgi:biotin-dependent carboxylase-like uncharacterized protein